MHESDGIWTYFRSRLVFPVVFILDLYWIVSRPPGILFILIWNSGFDAFGILLLSVVVFAISLWFCRGLGDFLIDIFSCFALFLVRGLFLRVKY